MKKRPLSLEDKAWIEPLLITLNSPFAEHSFANLYLFRALHKTMVVEEENDFLINTSRKGRKYLLPLKPISEINLKNLPIIEEKYIFPLEMPLSEKDHFYEEESDYLFDTEQFFLAEGRRYDGLRWNLKKLKEQGPLSKKPLSIEPCLEVLEQWREKHGNADIGECTEALQKLSDLKCFGEVIFVGEEVKGFYIAEERGKDILLHFAKAVPQKIAVYPYLYHSVAEEALKRNKKTMNWMEDLNIPSLREGKTRYHPIEKKKKWWHELV